MKLTNINKDYVSALGEGFVFRQDPVMDNESGTQVGVNTTYMNTRTAIGAILMFNGKSQDFPDAPEITMEDSQTMFALTQSLVEASREGNDYIDINAQEVVFLRKMGFYCLHKSVFGHFNNALALAENPQVGEVSGIAMTQ